MNLILRYAVGPMDILLGDELDTLDALDALKRIYQELEGLGEANPNLAVVLRRTVEAIHAALDKAVDSEQMKVLIRVVCLHQRLYDIANSGHANKGNATSVN